MDFKTDNLLMSLSQLEKGISSGLRVAYCFQSGVLRFGTKGILIGSLQNFVFRIDAPKNCQIIPLIKKNNSFRFKQ